MWREIPGSETILLGELKTRGFEREMHVIEQEIDLASEVELKPQDRRYKEANLYSYKGKLIIRAKNGSCKFQKHGLICGWTIISMVLDQGIEKAACIMWCVLHLEHYLVIFVKWVRCQRGWMPFLGSHRWTPVVSNFLTLPCALCPGASLRCYRLLWEVHESLSAGMYYRASERMRALPANTHKALPTQRHHPECS
jgi:hypothetical protein